METEYQHMWILAGHTPIPCPDALKWGRWYQTADRIVAQNQVGTLLVSTIFLGTNLRLGKGEPILFETVVFQNSSTLHKYSRKYSTWDEAVEGHQATITLVEADIEQ